MKLLASLLLALSCLSAIAGNQPNDTELRSAYCLRVLSGELRTMQNVLKEQPDFAGRYKADISKKEVDIDRLESYLNPKINTLDVPALLAAVKRADADQVSTVTALSACLSQCAGVDHAKRMQCINQCEETNPAWLRRDRCKSVDWLPF